MIEYALRPDSAGDERQRGAVGFRRSYEILAEGAKLAPHSDRFRRPAEGLFGGGGGGYGPAVERDAAAHAVDVADGLISVP